ncbi:MAG: OmpA family protein [Bacteroidales bacterium]|nr:OmpA family protein [Bacteroidales bacterium]
MFRFYALVLLIFVSVGMLAQKHIVLLPENGDCDNAIDITDINDIKATAPMGHGSRMEVQSSKVSLYAFKNEHNTVWYKFTILQSCMMSLTITPDNPKDDYDFLLFCGDGPSTCKHIQKGGLKAVRSNISRPKLQGKTGLVSSSKYAYVREGEGTAWSKSIFVKKGDVYYLVLDNVYDDGQGHRIQFFYNNCKAEPRLEPMGLHVNINAKDKSSKRGVKAHMLLIDLSGGYKNYDTLYNREAISVFIPIKAGRNYDCQVWAKGYLKEKELFRLDSADKPLKLDINLQKVQVGSSFEVSELYFVGGSATVVRRSHIALRKLLSMMKDNPSLEIEIQGHVNLPVETKKKKSEEYYQQLSVDRATTVYNYLRKRGISEKRMSYRGFGYKKMIYPHAKTFSQMQKNRRVVVRIISI